MNYCRPYKGGVVDTFEYWTDSESAVNVEFGTKDYPFKQLDSAPNEVSMFMFNEVTVTQYFSRGKLYQLYYVVAPIVLVNLNRFYLMPDPTEIVSIPRPRVIIDEHSYVWPPGTQFTIAQEKLDLTGRVARGDMTKAESEKFFLKYSLFRSSIEIHYGRKVLQSAVSRLRRG